jgi:glutamate synthase (NADPH/NADH) small chain
MAERMLKFTVVPRTTPEKRAAETRGQDFHEVYADYIDAKAACRSVRLTARCTTTSPTGCA